MFQSEWGGLHTKSHPARTGAEVRETFHHFLDLWFSENACKFQRRFSGELGGTVQRAAQERWERTDFECPFVEGEGDADHDNATAFLLIQEPGDFLPYLLT